MIVSMAGLQVFVVRFFFQGARKGMYCISLVATVSFVAVFLPLGLVPELTRYRLCVMSMNEHEHEQYWFRFDWFEHRCVLVFIAYLFTSVVNIIPNMVLAPG